MPDSAKPENNAAAPAARGTVSALRRVSVAVWTRLRRDRRWQAAAAALGLVILLVAGVQLNSRREERLRAERLSYSVRSMDLQISVLEGGNVASTNNFEIKSEVEGQTSIISIVPDGTVITEEDVTNKKVLVDLDAANLREKLAQQEIAFNDADASYAQARESYEIQKNQNESNIKEGELKAKFGRMDLEKYLGAELADKLLKGEVEATGILTAKSAAVDGPVSELAEPPALNGEALQKWRKAKADIDLAREEVSRARDRLEWSRKLGPPEPGGKGGNGYITRSELEGDSLALKRKEMEADQATLALRIFMAYEFPKEAVKLQSDYTEACRELERIQAKARAEIAKADAERRSREAGYNLQKERFEKAKRLVEKCTIVATRTGMVVYPSTQNFWDRTKIEAGAMIRERQVILTMPDPAKMGIIVRVHEAVVDKVKIGQRARIVLDAFPDKVLWGKVDKVAILPDTSNPWLNPDLKVYSTTIAIDNGSTMLKTGLSAKVEIMIETIRNVLAVPVQAVTAEKGQRLCYVLKDGTPLKRSVETGAGNDKFIQILRGLSAGEMVLLQPPEPILADTDWQDEKNRDNQPEGDPGAARPAPGADREPGRRDAGSPSGKPAAATVESPLAK